MQKIQNNSVLFGSTTATTRTITTRALNRVNMVPLSFPHPPSLHLMISPDPFLSSNKTPNTLTIIFHPVHMSPRQRMHRDTVPPPFLLPTILRQPVPRPLDPWGRIQTRCCLDGVGRFTVLCVSTIFGLLCWFHLLFLQSCFLLFLK